MDNTGRTTRRQPPRLVERGWTFIIESDEMNRAISRGRGRRGRRERRGRLIRNEFEVTSTGIIGGQESWNYSTEGEGEKIGTIPGGISPFDFVYSSFIGGIIGLICNLDSSSALSSSTGSILVQGRGGKRGRRSNFQASDTTPCNWRFNEREG